MNITISILLWIIIAKIFLYIGKEYLWSDDDNDDKLSY